MAATATTAAATLQVLQLAVAAALVVLQINLNYGCFFFSTSFLCHIS